MRFLVGARSSIGVMTGRSDYSAAKALERDAELRSNGSSQITFTNAGTGHPVAEAEVERIAEKESSDADRT